MISRILTRLGSIVAVFGGILGAVGAIAMAPDLAHAQEADWRVSGHTETALMLYSVPNIVRRPDGIVHVWSEQLNLKALGRAQAHALKYDRTLLDRVAGRIARYYIPPYLTLIEVNAKNTANAAMDIAVKEELADEQKVKPSAMFLFELDCKDKEMRYRILSGYTRDPSGFHDIQHPMAWDYAPPDSNGADLFKLVCDPLLTAPDNTPLPPRKPVGKSGAHR